MAQFIINCSDRISRPTAHLDKEVRIRRVDLNDLDLRHQTIDELGVAFELACRDEQGRFVSGFRRNLSRARVHSPGSSLVKIVPARSCSM